MNKSLIQQWLDEDGPELVGLELGLNMFFALGSFAVVSVYIAILLIYVL